VTLGFLADLGPEGVILLGAAAALAAGRRRGEHPASVVTAIGIAACLFAFADSVLLWHPSLGPAVPDIEHGSFLVDRYALFLHAVLLAGTVAVLCCTAAAARDLWPLQGEFTALVLLLTLGGMVTAASQDLVTIAVGLTVAAVAASLLVGLRKLDGAAAAAALQTFCLLAAGVACLLLGVVVTYGLTGSTRLAVVARALAHPHPAQVLAATALVMGGGALLGLGPFLGWRASGAGRAPLAAVLAVCVVGGTADLAALVRVLEAGFPHVPAAWTVLVAVLGSGTALVAAALALRAGTLRQLVLLLLAGDGALVLTALPAQSRHGAAAALFATLLLAPLAAGSLGVVLWVGEERSGRERLRGLWGRSPGPCAALVLVLVALVGLPPLAGFLSWFSVLGAAVAAGYGWVAWVAALALVLAGAAGLRWAAVLLDPDAEGDEVSWPEPLVACGLGLCGLALVLGGPVAGPLIGLAQRAARPLFLGF